MFEKKGEEVVLNGGEQGDIVFFDSRCGIIDSCDVDNPAEGLYLVA